MQTTPLLKRKDLQGPKLVLETKCHERGRFPVFHMEHPWTSSNTGLWKGNSKFGSGAPTSVCVCVAMDDYAEMLCDGEELLRLSAGLVRTFHLALLLGNVLLMGVAVLVLFCLGACCFLLCLTREFFAVVRIRCTSYGSSHSLCIGLL